MIKQVSVDAHAIHDLGHVSTLPGEDHLSGSVINTDDHRTHLVTGSHRLQDRRLMCSREPKANHRAVVPRSGLRTSTVSCTYGVSHPSSSVLRSGGQSRRRALDVAVRRTRVAPNETRAASTACSIGSNDKSRTNTCLLSTNHRRLGLEGVGNDQDARRALGPGPARIGWYRPRRPARLQLVAKVAPKERGDGFSLVQPLGPG